MSPTRRARLREATVRDIKRIARRLLAEGGAAGLSLAAIGREMGWATSAVYRYYPSRDDLITALLVDAFNDLADALEAARDAVPGDDHAGRLRAFVDEYRAWALTHFTEFDLIFGTPIPGYVAPTGPTLPAARRSMGVVIGILRDGHLAGRFRLPPDDAPLPEGLRRQLVAWRERDGLDVPLSALHLALVGWNRLHGLVTNELHGHLRPIIGDATELYRDETERLLQEVRLLGPSPN